jgi:hypothetical protein
MGLANACQFDVSGCTSKCGNGVQEGNEQCDGSDFNGLTCADFGFTGGTLSCGTSGPSACKIDTSNCQNTCGNNTIDPGEDCDYKVGGADKLPAGASCASLGQGTGTLHCYRNGGLGTPCTYDISGCSGTCGDGVRKGNEQCDTNDFSGLTCTSLGYFGGNLACTGTCTIDASGCNLCGNGFIEGTEACDMGNLNGHTCANSGFASGTISCKANCTLDTSLCTLCGNGVCDPGETDVNCHADCHCGNGVCDAGETDGTCHADCHCGNGVKDASEQCDTSDFGTATCNSVTSGTDMNGTLACTASCTYDTSGCTP